MKKLQSINPATGEVMKEYDQMTPEQIQETLTNAEEAFQKWKTTSFKERKEKMLKVAKILRDDKQKYAEIITKEMGKPIKESLALMEKCAWLCEYYAENAEDFLKNEIIKTDGQESYVRFDPLGIVLAVMPWNFPFWQVFRFAVPGLMAGNVGILKHASNVPQSALAIEEIFMKAGFPKYTFTTMLIGSKPVAGIIKDPRVKAATLTGSGPAGSAVASACGAEIKPTVLELGGSGPFIVLPDADLDLAVEKGMIARYLNAGQSCIAAKRFLLHNDIAEEFTQKFKAAVEALNVGDPMDMETQVGPLARADLVDELDKQVQASVKAGATVIVGGKPADREGAFYEPTILGNIKEGMPAYTEEFFGPVALFITIDSEEDAIKVANATEFGLAASIFSKDTKKAEELAKQIDTGGVFINEFAKSDPRLPFGGVKTSGYGRELSHYGIKEFVNIKTIVVKK